MLPSGDGKNTRRRISAKSFGNPPLRLPRQGLSRVQYYNRTGAKKSHRCGLERTGADIETEAFYPVVYCVRNKRKRLWAMKSNHPVGISCRRDGDCSETKFVVKIALSLFRKKRYSWTLNFWKSASLNAAKMQNSIEWLSPNASCRIF